MLIDVVNMKLCGVSDAKIYKNAFLIMAHNEPVQLLNLVNRLSREDILILIHIDSKSNIAPFVENLSKKKNVFLLTDRVSVSWGGYSQVQAMLILLKTGYLFTSVERFTFLSGQDYVIKPLDVIISTLDKNIKKSYVRSIKVVDGEKFSERYKSVHVNGYLNFMNLRGEVEAFDIAVKNQLEKKIKSLLRQNTKEVMKEYQPYPELHKGSQWVSLIRKHVSVVFDEVNNKPNLIPYFKYVGVPDECFFQTILKNKCNASEFINENLHFTRWEVNATGTGSDVAVLNAKSFSKIEESKFLFARKLQAKFSRTLLEKINDKLL